jgi:hypothetical protein
MSVPAYMLSILNRQQLLLGAGFGTRYRNAWLVWEPGPWRPARSVISSNLEETRAPGATTSARPTGEDAICFELKLKAEQRELKVGRASTNDIVINDLTASREQFTLINDEGRWFLTRPHGTVVVNDVAVDEGREKTVLEPGTRILVGDVTLSFYDSPVLLERLKLVQPPQA